MAAFNIPSSDDEWIEEHRLDNKKTLFDRRKEFQNVSQLQSQSDITKSLPAADESNKMDKYKMSKLPTPQTIGKSASHVETRACTDSAKPATSPTKKTTDISSSTSLQPSTSSSSAYRIVVNRKQKGNPILKFVRNVPWEFDSIIPDYELGRCACALYLSIKYHNRFPEYIHNRLKELGKSYELRIILVQVDTKQQDISHELNRLAQICILADCTMVLAFSLEEAGRYLELYKAYENKPPTEIMGRTKTDFLSQFQFNSTNSKKAPSRDGFSAVEADHNKFMKATYLGYSPIGLSNNTENPFVPPSLQQATEFLTSIKGVNKTDVTTLLTKYKTIKGIIVADVESLSMCPGIGPVKARRILNAFTATFLKKPASPTKHRDIDTVNENESDVSDN